MSKFITLKKIDGVHRDEDEVETEVTKVCLVNVASIRCLYGRRDDKPGTRVTFTDGGGFAVSESPEAIAAMIAGGDVSLAIAPTSGTAN